MDENKEEGGEMFAHGEGKLVLNEVKVVKPPNCWVKNVLGVAVIETNQIKVTSKGQGDSLQFIPAAGTVFAEFAIETNGGGVCAAELNPTKVVGNVNGTPEGATTKFDSTAVTNGGTLRIGSAVGPKAGLVGSVTISAGGDNVLITPAVGTVFAEFAIENNGGVCAAALNPVKVVGSVKGQPNGATIELNPTTVTSEGTLRIGSAVGPKVGLSGSETLKASKTHGEETKPISTTT